MAVTAFSLVTATDSDGNSTSATGSYTPTANRLVLAAVASRTGITADPNIPTLTGNSLTWVQVATVVYDNTSSSRRRITVFRALGASPSTGTLAFDFGGQNQTNVVMLVDEFSGIDTSGTNGSGAIVQSATNFDNATGTPVSTLTVTLGAFGSANNATYGAFGNGVATDTATAGSGFSKISEDNSGGTTIRETSEFKNSNDTSVDMSWSNVSELGGIAIEIKAAAVVSTVKLLALMGCG